MSYISQEVDDLEPFEINSKEITEISEMERNIVISILKKEFKKQEIISHQKGN